MSTVLTPKSTVPWYRQGWPWFLIALPAASVVAGVITLIIAIQTFDGLVVDDYYKEGRAIVQTIGRTEHAIELGMRAQLNVRSESVRVELAAADLTNIPRRIILSITHPTRGGQDQQLVMEGASGVFEGPVETLSTGRWLFQIEDEARSWRMNGAAFLPAAGVIEIDPARTGG